MTDKVDAFEARGLESLYRERARWTRFECRLDLSYKRRVQETIGRLEHYGNLRRAIPNRNIQWPGPTLPPKSST